MSAVFFYQRTDQQIETTFLFEIFLKLKKSMFIFLNLWDDRKK
ncbi:hypothetical protein CUZ96_0953 [Enterococcus lactis]|uniref:Uncharacterized protein n=1 Tax=Enterococcus faecium 505 TaxID=1134806 RepID=J6KFI2_ENTFC|nr:hypothetical protein HMPREF1348_00868 [Enterococcus faecium 505]MBL5005453.1 hypothetical protein [Enterococcus lactis]MBL5011290.1 hypothetical protein [Enterococcus lactis]